MCVCVCARACVCVCVCVVGVIERVYFCGSFLDNGLADLPAQHIWDWVRLYRVCA